MLWLKGYFHLHHPLKQRHRLDAAVRIATERLLSINVADFTPSPDMLKETSHRIRFMPHGGWGGG